MGEAVVYAQPRAVEYRSSGLPRAGPERPNDPLDGTYCCLPLGRMTVVRFCSSEQTSSSCLH